MPNGNPLVGEVWETTDATGRTIRGVVADVSPTILTLVSFTGNRFRIAPTRMLGTWRFSQSPPATALQCTRRGCPHPGILRYVHGQTTEWVCPRHLPVGVQATLTTESIGVSRPPAPAPASPGIIEAEFEEVTPIRCLNCNNPDPVEDQRVRLPPSASLWVCTRCNERWCILSTLTLPDGADQEQALFDALNETRVQLSVENYSIQDVSTSNALYRVFERADPSNALPNMCVYAGLPVRWDHAFASENPPNALLRLRLGGGPEHRAPPRPRQEAMMSGFQMMYGARPGVPNIPVPTPAPAEASPRESNGLLAEMAPTPFISKGTRWVNSSTGDIVEVAYLGRSTEIPHEPVIHFRRVSDDMEVNQLLLQRDFETMFRPYTQETTPKNRPEAVVEVLKDEEWEHVESGEVVRIESVDTKRNLVIVVAKERRKSVPMLDFVNAKWRRIVRKTAFERLMEDD